MNALVYNFSIPNYLKVRAADRLPTKRLERGDIPGLSEANLPKTPLRGDDWLRLAPVLTGICGSDMSMLLNRSGPALTPFVSFPLVPGHEVLATVVEMGPEVRGFSVGQRVVVNPVISCGMRGLVPCRSCSHGEPGLCTRSAEGELSAGMLTGFCHDLPGGWSTDMIVHRSQVFAVPDSIDARTAVVVEPFSVAVHAVLRNPPPPGAKVLIIGSGTIGLLVMAALRMLGHTSDVTVLSRHPHQTELARSFGATTVLERVAPGEAAVEIAGARRYKPVRGKPVYAGGFDWVYDCVGSAASVDDSLRVAGPKGQIMLVGCAAEVPKLDLSFVWARELQITGSYVYGPERSLEGAPHTFEVAMDLIQKRPEIDLASIVTHVFPLTDWQNAIRTSLVRGKESAVKIALDCSQPGETNA